MIAFVYYRFRVLPTSCSYKKIVNNNESLFREIVHFQYIETVVIKFPIMRKKLQ